MKTYKKYGSMRFTIDAKLRNNYRIMSAVRGPDSNYGPLQRFKILITRRIRGMVFTRDRTRGDWTNLIFTSQSWEFFKATVEAIENAAPAMTRSENSTATHFISHLINALEESPDQPWGEYRIRIKKRLQELKVTIISFRL